MTCPHCGAEQSADTRFCTECGKFIGSASEPSASETPVQEAPVVAVVPAAQTEPVQPVQPAVEPAPPAGSPWATIGTWGWIGILLLLQIPILNLILLILWSFGVSKKRVKQSFSRAVLILTLFCTIIMIVCMILVFYHFGPTISEYLDKLI